jgi:hypothetical protein
MHGSHAHVPAASASHAYGPGSVILELGEHIGALILEVPPGLAGHEIELSPSGGGPAHPLPGPGAGDRRGCQLRRCPARRPCLHTPSGGRTGLPRARSLFTAARSAGSASRK